jgi:hypothetical protein
MIPIIDFARMACRLHGIRAIILLHYRKNSVSLQDNLFYG